MTDVGVDVLARALYRQVELEGLIRHLARPYGENEPVFAGADGLGTADGQPLEGARRMRELYREVVPGEHRPADAGARWERCPTCEAWGVVRQEAPGPR